MRVKRAGEYTKVLCKRHVKTTTPFTEREVFAATLMYSIGVRKSGKGTPFYIAPSRNTYLRMARVLSDAMAEYDRDIAGLPHAEREEILDILTGKMTLDDDEEVTQS